MESECCDVRAIGVEISEVYDGILYWVCSDCHRAYIREFPGNPWRTGRSEFWVNHHNFVRGLS